MDPKVRTRQAAALEVERPHQFPCGRLPDLQIAVISGRRKHRAIVTERNVVDVGIVPLEGEDRRRRCLHHGCRSDRNSRTLRHEQPSIRAPVECAANARIAVQQSICRRRRRGAHRRPRDRPPLRRRVACRSLPEPTACSARGRRLADCWMLRLVRGPSRLVVPARPGLADQGR